MNTADRQTWMDKTERLNASATLEVGMRVRDPYGAEGTVVKIEDWAESGPLSIENHGTVTVLMDKDGEDEHYSLFGWERWLRRLDV